MFYWNCRRVVTSVVANGVLLACMCAAAVADDQPWLKDSKPAVERLKGIGQWMMTHKDSFIFVQGYYDRTLLGLYQLTGDQAYLDHVRKAVQKLLGLQKPDGYWGTGYGDVYFADTGSALALLVNYYRFATPDERKQIDGAFDKYFHLLLVKGDLKGKPFVHEDGSLGVGFHADKTGKVTGDYNVPYTIATALTGAQIFAGRYYIKGDERDKKIATNACNWILGTMAGDPPGNRQAQPGQFPYVMLTHASKGRDYDINGPGADADPNVWKIWPYDTSTYAGEGFIAAWTYVNDPEFRKTLGQRLRPHIEWLLRTQNEDGSWAKKDSGDQQRSHGVVNLLVWYYGNVDHDPRIVSALERYCNLILDKDRCEYFGICTTKPIATALAGRALLALIRPELDCNRWKDRSESPGKQ